MWITRVFLFVGVMYYEHVVTWSFFTPSVLQKKQKQHPTMPERVKIAKREIQWVIASPGYFSSKKQIGKDQSLVAFNNDLPNSQQ